MSELGLMDQEPRGRRADRNNRRRRKKQRKRNGCACLGVTLVLLGGLGAAGWYGYGFYQDRFGPAPDYSGQGTGEVQFEVEEGWGAGRIAQVLVEEGVVKSAEAFTEEANDNPAKASAIQPGPYPMKKQMSAAAAFAVLTDSKNVNTLIIPEGMRAVQIYEAVDKKLDLAKGTTAKAAKNTDLGLPDYAKGNPEGFLYPSRYPVGKNTDPGDLLKKMVAQAEAEYAEDGIEEAAKDLGKTPYDLIKIASMVQAEAQEAEDFPKVSRVVENRLEEDMMLQFDSTLNYALNRSTLTTTAEDQESDSPYNSYRVKGLPPTPIGNPGRQAIEAALKPAEGPWIYFVTVEEGDTRFTDSWEEHEKNVAEFNRNQREKGGG